MHWCVLHILTDLIDYTLFKYVQSNLYANNNSIKNVLHHIMWVRIDTTTTVLCSGGSGVVSLSHGVVVQRSASTIKVAGVCVEMCFNSVVMNNWRHSDCIQASVRTSTQDQLVSV